MKRILSLILSVVLIISAVPCIGIASAEQNDNQTDFITSNTDIDSLLSHVYEDNVPLGFNENIFSLYQPGWGFDSKDVYRTGYSSGWDMPVTVTADGASIGVASADFMPSYVTSHYSADENGTQLVNVALNATRAQNDGNPTVSVSFEQTNWGANADYAFDGKPASNGNSTWNTWVQQMRTGDEWLRIDFESETAVSKVRLNYFIDNNCKPAAVTRVEYYSGGVWKQVENMIGPTAGQNNWYDIFFDEAAAQSFRITFTPQSGKCIAIGEMEFLQQRELNRLELTGYKYISPDDCMTVIIDAENNGGSSTEVKVTANSSACSSAANGYLIGIKNDLNFVMGADPGFEISGTSLIDTITLQSGQSHRFIIVMTYSKEQTDTSKITGTVNCDEPLARQKSDFNRWFLSSIPYVDVPDEQIKQIYYFRWYVYRNNIRMTNDDYYIITEFLPNVSWAGLNNGISCAVGHHVADGMWLKNGDKYLDDYLSYWLDKGGAVRSYSTWIANAYYNRYLVTQDSTVFDYADRLAANYTSWESEKYTADKALYWQYPDRDGMEYNVDGWNVAAYRPTINSYQYADAMALYSIYSKKGQTDKAVYYKNKADSVKAATDSTLWDNTDNFYKAIRKDNSVWISRKDLIGYIPWMFELPDDTADTARAWEYLMDEDYFKSDFGPRTAEKAYAKAPTYDGVCRWNGPSWPFATSQTLLGLANLLNDYKNNGTVNSGDYFDLLKTYTRSQYKNGYPWIAEDLNADNGDWLVDLERSPNYNHSQYNNLIITGLFGIRPDDSDILTVNPLVPQSWDYFCLENVSYHNHLVTLLYDRDGTRYHVGTGYKIYIDGQLALSLPKVGYAEVPLNNDTIRVTAVDAGEDIQIFTGKQKSLTPIVCPENADNKNLIYSSSDDSVISIGSSGVITAFKNGSAVITVRSEDNPSICDSVQVTAAGAFVIYANKDYNYGEDIELTIATPIEVENIGLLNEDGRYLGKRESTYVISGDAKIWTVTTALNTRGYRRISILTKCADGDFADSGAAALVGVRVPVLDKSVMPEIYSVRMLNDEVEVNEVFSMTVITSMNVAKVGIYNENGIALGKISESYVDKGDRRTWTISAKIKTRGERELSFKTTDETNIFGDVQAVREIKVY